MITIGLTLKFRKKTKKTQANSTIFTKNLSSNSSFPLTVNTVASSWVLCPLNGAFPLNWVPLNRALHVLGVTTSAEANEINLASVRGFTYLVVGSLYGV